MEHTDEMIHKRREARQQQRIAQKKKQKRRLFFGTIFILALIVGICIGLATCVSGKDPASDEPPQQEQQGTQERATDGPAITWMTLPADRVLTAQQYFVYDCQTQQFLTTAGETDQTVYPASVTKLFTAYVAMQYLQVDEVLTVGDAVSLVAYGSSVAELEPVDQLTVAHLIEGMLLPSGNDAAYALAAAAGRRISGFYGLDAASAVAVFVEQMNKQAQRLGMTGTHFANPDGIHSDDHYTTYADLAIIGTLALKNPYIAACAKVSSATVKLTEDRTLSWKTTNALIDPASPYYCPLAVGLKTGQTPYAGSCLLSAFEKEDGTTLLIGVFGCPEEEDRFADTLQLFNATFE